MSRLWCCSGVAPLLHIAYAPLDTGKMPMLLSALPKNATRYSLLATRYSLLATRYLLLATRISFTIYQTD